MPLLDAYQALYSGMWHRPLGGRNTSIVVCFVHKEDDADEAETGEHGEQPESPVPFRDREDKRRK
jgi:hypothetical protein